VKILVADDSLVSRHLLSTTLSRWGYEPVVAFDGTSAVEILEAQDAPQLVVLDWMMPGLTGLEVCQRVRQKEKERYTYILLLSSKNHKEDLVEGIEAGADDYLIKPFDQHELRARLRAAIRLIELQNELVITREALREQATKDSLTQVWNRRSILENLAGELARGEREPRFCGVILVDLDHFKTINDTHGHFAGDAVLQESIRRMKSFIRKYDSIGRYGGEEFLIVLPGCDRQSTCAMAERLRRVLGNQEIRFPNGSVKLTASFGCTAAMRGVSVSSDQLIRRADEALYIAKRKGRNRVVFLSSNETARTSIPERSLVLWRPHGSTVEPPGSGSRNWHTPRHP
jgi:diguanylate cyclase (GGDEF)-like protein